MFVMYIICTVGFYTKAAYRVSKMLPKIFSRPVISLVLNHFCTYGDLNSDTKLLNPTLPHSDDIKNTFDKLYIQLNKNNKINYLDKVSMLNSA